MRGINKMKKVSILVIIMIIFSHLFSKNFNAIEGSILYYSYSKNDVMKNGTYESLKYSTNDLKSYYECFQGYQRTYSIDDIYEQFEFKGSYSRFLKTYLKLGLDLKYSKIVNGDFKKAVLIGITKNIYIRKFTFTFSPALNSTFNGTKNNIYQVSGKVNYKYRSLLLNSTTYFFKIINNEISQEKIDYLQESSISYYGDRIGAYGSFSFGDKYLLTTYDNTYLNLSGDDFRHSFHLGILHYPILRNWSINYEFRKSIYNDLSKIEYTINAHLLNIYFSW